MIETITIRSGSAEDIPSAIPLITEFVKESFEEIGFKVDADIAIKSFEKYADCSMVAYDGDKMVGLIAGQIVPIDTMDAMMFEEKVWFVSLPYRAGVGIELLNKMEEYLKFIEVDFISLAHLGNKRSPVMERLFSSRGYKLAESHYLKKL